ncbi:SRPBCC domain-containing protein [Bradyrhizobium sp.]|uniref:SRPBCC family protein n=1 Tax=Bradyrhizobium sp. TaxID=376 RepID=UPI001E112AF0|nr:SRPBCC domain-containing protein [Bradyrhizobium sp.]MBI5320813.1 SRPBCC domain-containing protein [Bradyrhizobium sp.]
MAQPAAAKPAFVERPSLTLTRRFRARPEKVWAAWTDPETLIGWFCTTKAKPGTLRAELDVRIGGRYRISFDMESGEHSEVGGVYQEVVPNEKLVFSWAWHSTPERESLVTVAIKPDGAGSLMVFTHEQFFDETARDNHTKGWNELFAQLEAILA